jgi:hypothetical protein
VNPLDQLGIYAAQLHVGYARAFQKDKGLTAIMVALGWLAFPFGLQSLLHPGDVIRLQCRLLGQRMPHVVTAQQMSVAFVETFVALAMLIVLQMVATVLFYRRAQLNGATAASPQLWPLAALFITLCNAAWFFGTAVFDPSGCVIGFCSVALTIGAEILVEGLGRDFILGSAASNLHP